MLENYKIWVVVDSNVKKEEDSAKEGVNERVNERVNEGVTPK